MKDDCPPLDLSSNVQPRSSSWTSSGSTSFLDQASDQRGLGGTTGAGLPCSTCFFDLTLARVKSFSLSFLKTFEKNGMVCQMLRVKSSLQFAGEGPHSAAKAGQSGGEARAQISKS